MFSTRIQECTIGRIVMETCNAIYSRLKDDYLKIPATSDEWEQIADNFENRWNFPHCIGALDGKHIVFRASTADGSIYYNYKGSNSIVLMAMADSEYRFTYIDVGVNGRVSDGGVFRNSELHRALESGELNLPECRPLPGRQENVPYFLVADDAFPLKTYLMKPYPLRNLSHDERIFNYRLSRARRIIENAFGIFSNRFQVFLKPINLSVEKVKIITLAACALHNFLIDSSDAHYLSPLNVDRETADGSVEPGSWRSGPHFNQQMSHQSGNRCDQNAMEVRKELTGYVNKEGKVPWQEERI